MKSYSVGVLVVFLVSAVTGWGAPVKYSDLAKEEAFASATPEQRLEILHKKIENKEIASYDVSADVVGRLFRVRLLDEADAGARLAVYGQLRAKYSKLPATYELETHLAVEFLAVSPEGQKGDLVGMMKWIKRFQDEGKMSWPAVAPLHDGMLAAYLISNAEYQGLPAKDKVVFLRKLCAEGAVADMTATHFAVGVVASELARTPPEQQKAVFDEIAPTLDFFTKSAIRNAYEFP